MSIPPRYFKGATGTGPNGRLLCRCGCGRECLPPRRTFFNDDCVQEYLIRADGREMRAAVYRRDKGVCAVCGVDTDQKARELLTMKPRQLQAWCEARHIPRKRVKVRGFWDADHIKPVVAGGGACGLDNLRTLCIPCHKRATAQLANQGALQRKQPKPHIQTTFIEQ